MDRALLDLARANHGMLTRAQAAERGLTNKMLRGLVARNVLVEVLPGVFWLCAVPFTWESKVKAATTWARPAAGACRTAAAGWGLDGFPKDRIDVVSTRAPHPPDWLNLRRTDELPASDVRIRNGLPFTSVERTLAELGAVCGPQKVEQALDDALRKRLTTLPRLINYIDQRGGRGRNGCKSLRRLVEARFKEPKITQSVFEDAFLTMTSKFNLPIPTKQHLVTVAGRRFFLDFAYPSALVGIEAWSYAFHSARDDWEHDQERHNLITSMGWRLLYVTHRQLCEAPHEIAGEIRELLRGTLLF